MILSVWNVKGPPSPKRPCTPRSRCLWISCNKKLFLSRFSFKIRVLRSHLVKNRPCACRNLFFNYQAVVSWNHFVTEPAKRFFFRCSYSNMFPAKRYLAVEDPVRLSQRKILSVFVSEELVLWSKETDIWWISCSDVVWIPDCIGCGTLTSKFDSFELNLFARCK